MDEFTRHMDKAFLEAIERTVTDACEEMQEQCRSCNHMANWNLIATAAWNETIDEAISRIVGSITYPRLWQSGSVSEPIAHNPDQKLNRFHR